MRHQPLPPTVVGSAAPVAGRGKWRRFRGQLTVCGSGRWSRPCRGVRGRRNLRFRSSRRNGAGTGGRTAVRGCAGMTQRPSGLPGEMAGARMVNRFARKAGAATAGMISRVRGGSRLARMRMPPGGYCHKMAVMARSRWRDWASAWPHQPARITAAPAVGCAGFRGPARRPTRPAPPRAKRSPAGSRCPLIAAPRGCHRPCRPPPTSAPPARPRLGPPCALAGSAAWRAGQGRARSQGEPGLPCDGLALARPLPEVWACVPQTGTMR